MDGTCRWILETVEYLQWKSSFNQSIGSRGLWVSGHPGLFTFFRLIFNSALSLFLRLFPSSSVDTAYQIGTGKTVLASFLVEDIRSAPGLDALVFFFKDGNIKTSLPTEAFASMILQLIHLANQHSPDLQRRLVAILKAVINKNAGFVDGGRTNLSEIQTALTDMLREYTRSERKVAIVIDALDECANPTALISSFLDSGLSEVARFIITGRPTQDIQSNLGDSEQITTIQMNVTDDIKVFIEKSVAAVPGLGRHQTQIISAVLGKSSSNSMFRFGALLLEDLKSPSPESVSKRVRKIPKGLNEMYEAILLRLDSDDLELRRMVLAWIAVARRPPRVDEIAYAFATVLSEPEFDPEDTVLVTKEQILKSCGSLIEIFNGDELRFTHLTVKEFLMSPPRKGLVDDKVVRCLVNSTDAHVDISARCCKTVFFVPVEFRIFVLTLRP